MDIIVAVFSIIPIIGTILWGLVMAGPKENRPIFNDEFYITFGVIVVLWVLSAFILFSIKDVLPFETLTFIARIVSVTGTVTMLGLLAINISYETSLSQEYTDFISAHASEINKFPEYIPDQATEFQEIMKYAHFPPSLKQRIVPIVQRYLAQANVITKSQLIEKLKTSVNPQYDLEYALDRQLPGKDRISKLGGALEQLSRLTSHLLVFDPNGRPISDFVRLNGIPYLPEEIVNEVKTLTVRFALPDDLRTTHHQIISSSGHGKTSLIQSMILDDLEEDAAIVVIDSQNRMINELAQVVPEDRLVLIDPEHCPPALNMFARAGLDERSVANALELYEYVFGALDAAMTSKQRLVYRYLSRLCMVVPGANLATMRDMLQPGGIEPYSQYIGQLGENAVAFFTEFMPNKGQYTETKQEVLRRLLTVLESNTFARMLGARENKLNLPEMLQGGKVVLVSTNKELLKGNAALLGRIFLAQVMQAVMARKDTSQRVYLYVDEFKDYAEDSDILLDLFSQSRKYNMAMIVCHQELSQLTPKLAATISSNTAIKMVGGVSFEDANKLAKQIRSTPEEIERLRVGQFIAWFKGIGTMPWSVDPDRLAKRQKVNSLDHVRGRMREKYGAQAAATSTNFGWSVSGTVTQKPKPADGEEKSKW